MTAVKTLPLDLQIDVTFWHEFTRRKLEIFKLSEKVIPIYGSIEPGSNIIRLTHASFERHESCIEGELLNYNTLISFKESDKKAIFTEFSERCMKLYEEDYSVVAKFILIAYGDLKKYDFHFIGGCPVPKQHKVIGEFVNINNEESNGLLNKFKEKNCIVLNNQFEPLKKGDNEAYILDLSPVKETPGWTVRTLIHHKMDIIHCIRPNNSFTLKLTHLEEPLKGSSGWFTVKSTGKIATQIHHLAESMNPEMLASQAVDLNLQLMKWQLFRNLDLPAIQATKCLLIGAGTLGCNVSRVLMGWGVQNITFVDNGIISYSNPVRQSLYKFEDCVDKKYKAQRAAEMVKEVFPGMKSKGIVMSIPMPGHPIGEKEIEPTKKDILLLDQLVQEHDVVFLLGDSRECRWLPSMLCSVYNKICITVGLGFDSFVVMRHGDSSLDKEHKPSCYFCADIVAPTDSLSRRTLDQQCTVTRPGISYIASALAVEILISMIHHPLHSKAPTSGEGYIPHQLRGYLNTWKIEEGVGSAYSKCIACSEAIKEAYTKSGVEMVLDAVNNPKTLEKIVGIPQEVENDIEILTDSEDI
ncbi:autophagy protein, putative [Entamoeba dispar SAW760]|uniref:Autophagy protein, putative n=1 Tax=Entamoeba dispar (strain ATCC PRA-260 / SAW760) TaxID=370354 RepID=B0ETG1_ENTDS|nr:autophagy protein, putative [Entamoeba dispar SAW760]EDR22146.1 autophagy protein, putative [Entamoeba dispar SAW760]|eukprot:EDR22146.1 autophagy protein, putative [Entamoeba dispar SAW760]